MHPSNQKDMEHFADLLNVTVINLKEAGCKGRSLYTKLQQKMMQTMLAQYHRWISEKHSECVETLCTFILEEAKLLTITHETVYGMTDCHIEKPRYSWPAARTFFSRDDQSSQSCKVCHHGAWKKKLKDCPLIVIIITLLKYAYIKVIR